MAWFLLPPEKMSRPGQAGLDQSIPFGLAWILFGLVFDTLRKIVKDKQAQTVKFDNKKSTKVDLFTASALVAVYDKVNKKNQEKIKRMANKSPDQFMKVVDVAMKMVK